MEAGPGVIICVIFSILMASAIANEDYVLRCELQEMGILWPNYRDNTAYYYCPRLGEKPITMRCDTGKMFCFVLQLCVGSNEYIPPPPLQLLPTAKPSVTPTPETSSSKRPTPPLPTPRYPTGSSQKPQPANTPKPIATPHPPSTAFTPPTPPSFTKPPGPPSPPVSNGEVPLPPTPRPTPQTINMTPPGPKDQMS